MFEKRSKANAVPARHLLGAATGLSVALCLALAPAPQAQAAPAAVLAATTTCAAPWNAATAYSGGAQVSENGVNYGANWWTQGDDPATHSGAVGTGQPWTAQGECGGSAPAPGPSPSPSPSPSPAPGSCAPAWDAGTVYNGGDEASEDGVNYKAGWWNQDDDPATHSGAAGSGQPWTNEGACTGGSQPPSPPPAPAPSPTPSPSPSPAPSPAPAPGPAPSFVFSPYKDVGINANWNTDVVSTKVTGTLIPLAGDGGLLPSQLPGLKTVTLAFATGECGSENWAGIAAQPFADANVSLLDKAGINYIVSTGGAAGTFTCSSPAGMSTFINRYMSPHMIGVDFDIEGGQTQAQINSLVSQVAYAEGQFPNLRFSFTLATLAASDGSYAGVNSLGAMVVNAVKNVHLTNYTINLMVMDYGGASSSVCVVANGKCDMGQSAIQAAENLEHTFGIPASKIELTPMIGVNDVSSELFSLQDVDTMMQYVTSQGLAGAHFWSLDRDTPCSSATASSTCSSVPGVAALGYTKRFVSDSAK
ncbi:MAG TPA: carbohydrate-binding protein [Rhodanobacteraceae bacterium]